jgi:hypothetical protein
MSIKKENRENGEGLAAYDGLFSGETRAGQNGRYTTQNIACQRPCDFPCLPHKTALMCLTNGQDRLYSLCNYRETLCLVASSLQRHPFQLAREPRITTTAAIALRDEKDRKPITPSR